MHGGLLALERTAFHKQLTRNWPRVLRVASTLFWVLLAWVFFRAPDFSAAMEYFGRLFALTAAERSADLISGVIYQPYYVATFFMAALVAWTFPTVWAWTQKMTWPKAAFCLSALWISLIVLLTQTYNPFIYFIF
jgi:alginate O-acetyltransferase complex protein AlgI